MTIQEERQLKSINVITVIILAVQVVALPFYGWLALGHINQEARLSSVETSYLDQDDVRIIRKEINQSIASSMGSITSILDQIVEQQRTPHPWMASMISDMKIDIRELRERLEKEGR